jgi:hypothetical protein
VTNVIPTATFSNGGPVNEGSAGVVSFSNQADPSTVDAGALRYSYDFNNDGDFDDAGELAGSASPTATVPAAYLAEGPGTRTVRGRIADDDGGFTDYTTTLTINNVAPTATISNNGPVLPGNPVTVSFSNQSDPSPIDVAAGFTYSYDFDNDNVFEVANSTSPSQGHTYATPGNYTVRGRITDKDGDSTTYTTIVNVVSGIIDDGQPGYSQVGAWVTASDNPTSFGPTYRYAAAGDGSAVAAWQFDLATTGSYDVQVTWTAFSNRASDAPYRIYSGTTLLRTVRVDQRLAPSGPVVNGVAFQSLGVLTVPAGGGPLRVELGNDADSFVIADAARAVPAVPPAAIDDGQAVQPGGAWTRRDNPPASARPTATRRRRRRRPPPAGLDAPAGASYGCR